MANEERSKYDVFLACPMAGFQSQERYVDFRGEMLKVKHALEISCKAESIYFPPQSIATIHDFDKNFVASKVELIALQQSRVFMMIYPGRIVSSVLFQAGYALGLKKLSIHFAKKNELPFLMQELEHLPRDFGEVRLYGFDDAVEIVAILKKNGPEFLS